MDATPDLLFSQRGKPTLHLIEPRSGCWLDMDMKTTQFLHRLQRDIKHVGYDLVAGLLAQLRTMRERKATPELS